MPGPLTYVAITLLARDRIGQIKRALQAKKAAGTAKELDLHVLHLATQAEVMMNASQPVIEPPVRLYGPPLTEQVSRFTLLGAVGPDLPRYAAYFVPGQRWLFDTLHKGSPDEHRERVLTNSTNLVFDFLRRVDPLIDEDIKDLKKRSAAKLQMQAYAFGHLCHVAADVLSHPYFENIESRLTAPALGNTPAVRFMKHDDIVGAFDVRIAQTFFARGTDTRNKKWANWFPTPGEVPDAFSKAMAASIQALYGARATGLPAFEESFGKIDPAPPPLSVDLIDESVDYFRTIIEIERVWTYCDWLGATAAMFLPMSFAYLGALALPFGKDLSRELTAADPEDAEDRRVYESVVFPLAFSALGPLVTMIIVSASGRQLRAEGVTGWVNAGLSLAGTIGFFASLGGAGAARWTLLFGLPMAFALFQIIFAAVRGNKENARKLLWLGPVVQIALALFFLLLYKTWLHEGVEELQKDASERDDAKAFGYFAAWIAIVLALWFLNAVFFRWVFSSSVPDDKNLFAGGEPRQFLRLYDDTTLVHDLGKPAASDLLADLSYPPARRAMIKLWWEPKLGPTLSVKVGHDRVEFQWLGAPPVANRIVFAPVAPITIEKWSALLASHITGDGSVGTLHVAPVRDDEKTIELAPGTLFSDNGDTKTVQAEHDLEAGNFKPVGATEKDAFVLFHTPRPRLASQMGKRGVVPDLARGEQVTTKAGLLLQPVGGATPRLYRATPATDGSSPFLRAMFQPGDIIEVASAPTARRIVESVDNDTDLTLSSAFDAAVVFPAAGLPYKRVASNRAVRLRGASTVSTPTADIGVGPNDIQIDNAAMFFGTEFVAGDTVDIGTTMFQRRRVVSVRDVTPVGSAPVVSTNLLELDAPLSPAAGGASGNLSLLQPAATGGPTQYTATNDSSGNSPDLDVLFAVGDVIEIASGAPVGEQRTITKVVSDTDIVVNAAFASAIPAAGIGYKRVTFIDRVSEVDVDGFPMFADPSDVFGDSESVMNDAADLATLLCLGAASRMQPNNAPVAPPGGKIPVHRVSQVFRNWNLDRRRMNEWKLMVSGGAESERRGDFTVAEEAVSVDPADAGEVLSAALITQRTAADAVVREHGWLGVFRSWVDMASREGTDTSSTEVFRPGDPSNRDLSQAMAYLLDSREGVA